MVKRSESIALALGLGLFGLASYVQAAGDANAAKGLVADNCGKCHETPYSKPGERSEAVEAPSFQAMANDSASYSPEKMRATLLQPHFPMQQFILSKRDIDNIIAYLASLKRN
ncbi:MAG: hypothetical protein DWQ09_09735 [Proteobacteria bacterium]|nr:MAG: hypothetical protein DWQ09_09735 [Pseudomonadota bacterium]QKK10596.1 MAG: hypothetical protein HND59_02230 [Pseudomonadota bacterium]